MTCAAHCREKLSALKTLMLYKKCVEIPNSKDPKAILFRVVLIGQRTWTVRRRH